VLRGTVVFLCETLEIRSTEGSIGGIASVFSTPHTILLHVRDLSTQERASTVEYVSEYGSIEGMRKA
jgi:hypothetical protein